MESVARRALARLLTMQELGSGDDKDVTTTVSHVTAAVMNEQLDDAVRWGRLPFQLVFIWLAYWTSRDARPSSVEAGAEPT